MTKNVSSKQHRAVIALLTCTTVGKAATAAGIADRTIYRWLKEPAFLAELRSAESEALAAVTRKLVSLAGKAASVLDVVLDGTSPLETSVRVRAADIVLARLMPLREMVDTESRLAAIEEKLHETSE